MLMNPAFLIGIATMIIGMIISGILKSKFQKYSKLRLSSNFSGKEIAEKMLRDNAISDVKVVSVERRCHEKL